MAFGINNKAVFALRCQNFVTNLQGAYEEAGKINDIYVNEAGSGADSVWVDNDNSPIATNAELTEAINLMLRLRDCLALDGQTAAIASEDQTSRLTPFLQ